MNRANTCPGPRANGNAISQSSRRRSLRLVRMAVRQADQAGDHHHRTDDGEKIFHDTQDVPELLQGDARHDGEQRLAAINR